MMKRITHIVMLLIALTAVAAAEGPEATFEHSRLRLFDGGRAGATHTTGLGIQMAQGWKTYWRMPGDAGIPPGFDFSGSENVASVRILYPRPTRYSSPETGDSIGYSGQVIFPLQVRLKDPAAAAVLRVKITYGLCRDVCIPVEATLRRTLPPAGADPREVALVKAWLKQVPAPATGALKVAAAEVMEQDGKPVLKLVVHGAEEGVDILVEGPPLAMFGKPKAVGGAGAYVLPVSGIDEPQALKGRALTVTILARGRAVEQKVTLP
ncbi:MAG TPA: hypothetical protein ENK15_09485 [Thermopetrobacter sp.]|nr:hypothetical protein [Thermopetrobacter sp.]